MNSNKQKIPISVVLISLNEQNNIERASNSVNWAADVVVYDSGAIHEKVEAKNYENLISSLNHYVFKNIEDQARANNRYSGLQAKKMFDSGKKFSWAKLRELELAHDKRSK